jgi:hypothetical protein
MPLGKLSMFPVGGKGLLPVHARPVLADQLQVGLGTPPIELLFRWP